MFAITRKFLKGSICVALPVLLLASCGSSTDSSSDSSAPSWKQSGGLGSKSNPIKMGIGRISLFMQAYDVPDVLAKQGIYVKLLELPATPQRLQALLGGDLDVTFAGWVDTIKLSSKDAGLVVISDVARGGAAMVAGADTDIRSPRDWAGKKIGISKGSMQDMVAQWEIKKSGVAPGSVDLIHMSFSDMAVALKKGNLDGYVGTAPYPAISVADGARSLGSYTDDVPWGDLNANMVATSGFVKKHSDLCAKLVDALTQATQQATIESTKKKAVSEFKVPASAVDFVLDNIKYTTELDLTAIQAFIDAEVEVGYIDSKPDIKDFVSTKFAKVVGG